MRELIISICFLKLHHVSESAKYIGGEFVSTLTVRLIKVASSLACFLLWMS